LIKALFLDFYGTIVHEDGTVIKIVSQKIFDTGIVENKLDIGAFWWKEFQKMCMNSYGENFQTQRAIEYQSLLNTLNNFNSSADAVELSDLMFEHWIKQPIFEESKEFFEKTILPIYIVSNIDKNDILKAIEHHGLKPTGIFTSEDAKAYKPRKELFELALKSTGLSAKEVVHIGDSMSSDIKGASELGIETIWVNRTNKNTAENVITVSNLLDIYKTKLFCN